MDRQIAQYLELDYFGRRCSRRRNKRVEISEPVQYRRANVGQLCNSGFRRLARFSPNHQQNAGRDNEEANKPIGKSEQRTENERPARGNDSPVLHSTRVCLSARCETMEKYGRSDRVAADRVTSAFRTEADMCSQRVNVR